MRKYYGDGRARPRCPWATAGTGCETRARPRYRWAAAGPEQAHAPQAPPDWRPPRGLRGLAGLRDDAPSKARRADGERAGRPRGGRRSVGATSHATGRRPPAHTAARPTGQDARRPEIRRCHKQRKNP